MAKKFEVGQAVVINDGGDLNGFEGSVWEVNGDHIGVKYRFLGACKPAGAPAVFSAAHLKFGGAGPCPPPAQEFAAMMMRQREYCCDTMQAELESVSEDARSVFYSAKHDEIGLVHPTEPDYYKPIGYCPWCGTKIGTNGE